jgi:hypothetical protein
MATMCELDWTTGVEGWSISTKWALLIVPAVYTAGSPHRLARRVRGQRAYGKTFAARVTPATRSRGLTHVEVDARRRTKCL